MKKVVKNRTDGDVEKSHRIARAAMVMPRRVHLGSGGQVAWDEARSMKLKAFGKVDGKLTD
jgi:hypothetical protein